MLTTRIFTPIANGGVGTVVALLIGVAGCGGSRAAPGSAAPVSLRIGFGLVTGASAEDADPISLDIGIQGLAGNIATELLVSPAQDGRTGAGVAESWAVSSDGLVWRIQLRPGLRFHDGTPADAAAVREIVATRLPRELGPSFEDVDQIRTAGDDLEITLRRRSTFLIEALTGISIRKPGGIGTGPFRSTGQTGNTIEMAANADYYGGKPSLDRISIKPYPSVRAAWADLLRGEVDMLYDVGIDALDSLKSSNEVNLFPFQRGYAYLLLLNPQQPQLRDPAFRRELNAAIDRDALIADGLNGHGAPALGPVWPHHWAYRASFPQLAYHPRPPSATAPRRRLSILIGEPSQERLALVLQRQLQAIGVDTVLEPVTDAFDRVRAGKFDAVLVDAVQGPNMVRPSLFWHTGGPYNWGHYSNQQVDAALDSIRHAVDDEAYQNGVAAFQRAIVDDPPAIFLSWRERARAVSKRFVVPPDPGADVLTTIHLWRPAANTMTRARN
ncbi:MAG: ABC transporter substrate-binding protein [Acidobacteriota bacterium]